MQRQPMLKEFLVSQQPKTKMEMEEKKTTYIYYNTRVIFHILDLNDRKRQRDIIIWI